jgi:hypothetical protein
LARLGARRPAANGADRPDRRELLQNLGDMQNPIAGNTDVFPPSRRRQGRRREGGRDGSLRFGR